MSWDFPDSLQYPTAAKKSMAVDLLLTNLCNYEYTAYQV